MDEDGLIIEHFREVHSIPGVPAMKPLQQIEVDAKQDFAIPDLRSDCRERKRQNLGSLVCNVNDKISVPRLQTRNRDFVVCNTNGGTEILSFTFPAVGP